MASFIITKLVLLFIVSSVYGKYVRKPSQFNDMNDFDKFSDENEIIQDYRDYPIGEAFDIPNTNFYSSLTQGNKIIKKQQAQGCFRITKTKHSQATLKISSDLESVYKSVSKEADLSADFTYFVTVKTSLRAISSSIKWTNSTAKSSQVDYSSQTSVISLDLSCIRKHLSHSFRKDLKTLDVKISKPELESSWKNYESFVKRYGTHVMSRIYFGARLQYFVATQSSSSISDEMMAARACVEVEGQFLRSPFKVHGCESYNSTKRQESSLYSMQLQKFIRGGDNNLRQQLLLADTMEPSMIENFINTAGQYPEPIRYAFNAIWDLFPNEMLQQKNNFYAYYTGYVQTGCTQLLGPSNYILRQFRHDPLDESSYQCVTRSRGCHQEDDCHYSWGQTGCLCGGPTCVEYATKGDPYIKDLPAGSIWDPVSAHCQYYVGTGCSCENRQAQFITKWPTKPKYVY